MDIEYEATFINISKDDIRAKLQALGATLVKPEFLQRRVVFNLPPGLHDPYTWLRVRDEGDKITLSLKRINGSQIDDQKELCLQVDDMTKAIELLQTLGCPLKSKQESTRELWTLDGTEITIDQWPYLEAFVEVEGTSEEKVKDISLRLGFDYSQALFCAVGKLYEMKYGIPEEEINQRMPEISFSKENPFLLSKSDLTENTL